MLYTVKCIWDAVGMLGNGFVGMLATNESVHTCAIIFFRTTRLLGTNTLPAEASANYLRVS